MRKVKCPVCGEMIERENEYFISYRQRYYHVDCFLQKYSNRKEDIEESLSKMGENERQVIIEEKVIPKEPKKILRKCFYCGKDVDISNEENFRKPRVNRYAHIECFEKNYNEDDGFIDEIYSYLKNIGMRYDYVQCEKQRVSYISKMGYTNHGILNALKYFYSIQHGSIANSGNRIGIVPYVYDEAQIFYNELDKTQKRIKKEITKQFEEAHREIEIKLPEITVEKGYIDIDKIGSD